MIFEMYKTANVYQERLNTFPIKESDYIEDCDYRFDDKETVIEIFGENIVAAIREELGDEERLFSIRYFSRSGARRLLRRV